jgi:uncharacterized protein (DUF952 family)
MQQHIYKICPKTLWREAQSVGRFEGAPIDHADGFIHFSSADQIRETTARHFSGRTGLCLLTVAVEPLGAALRWEVSRGGAHFPHLRGPLLLSTVRDVQPLPLQADGAHRFPMGIP